ncbi:MAG: alkaline phosphatase family protein [Planctomycetota bacterium]|jgi:predicted AlkP superfamily phosphohydrolase/phosphomutase
MQRAPFVLSSSQYNQVLLDHRPHFRYDFFMPKTNQLLLIGLDAADPVLIEQWVADGTLPNLAALKKSGTYGRLNTSAKYLAGSPWPTFYTGQTPNQHGIYQDFQWHHEKLKFAYPTFNWIPVEPFWRHIDRNLKVVVYDVPMTQGCQAFEGTEISNWASHDKLVQPDSYPAELLAVIAHRFGKWPMVHETFGPASIDELLDLRQHLLKNIKRSTKLVLWLLKRPWNFAIAVFGALHRGGHRLWDRSSVKGTIPESKGKIFDHALKDLYLACDDAVGKLVESSPGASVIVFSLHGMTKNNTRVDFLDEMLTRVLFNKNKFFHQGGLVRRIGEALPNDWRGFININMPHRFRNRLMTWWTTSGIDWKNAPAFTLRADVQGFIRINLKGREPEGIISPGNDYEELCDRIANGLMSFRDASTGQSFIEEVCRTDKLYEDGDRRDRLPDLIVRWKDMPSIVNSAIESPRFGCIKRKTPGRIPNGRSGNHRPEGLLIACGKRIPAGEQLQTKADIIDLAPTILHYLGAHTSLPLSGRLIPELTFSK